MIKEEEAEEEEECEEDGEFLVDACLMVEETANEVSNNYLRCDLCHQVVQSTDMRSLHYVLNHGCKICSICSQVFITLNTFKSHERAKHFHFPCDRCDTTFLTYGELQKHRNNYHELYKCPLCPFEFYYEKDVSLHLVKYHFITSNNFTVSHNFVMEWSDSDLKYLCNMCGVRRDKIDVFMHFLEFHHVSLLPLAQKFMSQNLNIRVPGTKSPGKEVQLPPSLSVCTGCSEHIGEEVPLPAHNLICLGYSICKFCFECFSERGSRDDHILKEHSFFPCLLGCSNRTVFPNEDKLNEHCLSVHDVKPCSLCGSYIRCAEGLMKQHLQTGHLYWRSDEFLLSDTPFRLQCSNTAANFMCDLCDIDCLLQINNVVDMFTHLNYHAVSFKAALHFLEENSFDMILYSKFKEMRSLENYYKDNNGELEVDCNLNETLPALDDLKEEMVELDSVSEKSSVCEEESEKLLEFSDEENTFCVNERDLSPTVEINELDCDDKNIEPVVNEMLKVNDTDEESESQIDGKNEMDGENQVDIKPQIGSELQKDGDNQLDSEPQASGDVQSIGEPQMASEVKQEKEGYDSSDESVKQEWISSEDEIEENGTDDDPDFEHNIQTAVKLNLFNIKSEVDPCEVECVVTDTSDIESDDGLTTKTDHIPNDVQNGYNKTKKDRKRSNSLDGKSLPGLNRMDVSSSKGFCCEVCNGKFDPHEGMRELIKHMKTLHGFNCNFNGQKLSTIFKFNRSKTESSIKMQPGLVCPVCMMGWMSKRLLRVHVSACHGNEWLDKEPNGPLSYQCRHCNKGFWRASECHLHETKEHGDINPVQCHVCSETMLRKVCLNLHLKTVHPKEKLHSYVSFKCKRCSKLYATFRMLDRHVRTVHPTCVVYRCPHCHNPLKSKKTLAEHIKTQHRVNRTYECEECGRTLYSKRALSIHTQLKHHQANKFRFKCRLCERTFESKEARKAHYRIDHSKENIFHCRECGKGFASKSGLYGHKQVHLMSIDAYKCEFCHKEFSRRDSFNEHLQIHSGPRHTCPHCGKEFVQRSNMVRHIRIHTGEKPYKCSHCDKTFSDKGACNAHIRVHTREEVSSCPYCEKTFSKKQKLKYHIRKHTGEGLVLCEICGKSFTHNFLLKEHRTIHDQQTQLLCGECGRAFNSSKYLLRHVQSVHHPSHMYTCPLCSKTFTKQSRAKQHIMSHADYKRLQCLLCHKFYTTLNSLRKHLTLVHELSKDHPDYKNVFERLAIEREECLKFQRQIDLTTIMKGMPAERVKVERNDDDEDYDKKFRKRLEREKAKALKEGKTTGDVSTEESVSSIGQRIVRNSRKSRPTCLMELDVEDTSSEEDFKLAKWDENSTGFNNGEAEPNSTDNYAFRGEFISDVNEKQGKKYSKGKDKSSKKKRVESIANVLQEQTTDRAKVRGNF